MANEKRLDLIDRQALGIGRCNPDAFPLQNRGYVAGWNGVISLLEEAPRVDAVEVVRCKDCKHYMEYPLNKVDKRMCCYVHLLTPHFTPEDGFCSYGERKNDG